MGIVLLPFLFLATRGAVLSGIAVYKAIKNKAITSKHCVIALVITLVIYTVLFASYFFSESAYAFSPYFLFPFFMVLVPYLISLWLSKDPKDIEVYKSFIISTLFSTFFLIVFYKYTLGIIQYLKLPIYH